MTFRDQAALKEFYWQGHQKHAEIRQRVYEFLDPNVAPLYKAAKGAGGDGFGDAIERIVRKYMVRMDYVIPDPYFIYRGGRSATVCGRAELTAAVAAAAATGPSFGSWSLRASTS